MRATLNYLKWLALVVAGVVSFTELSATASATSAADNRPPGPSVQVFGQVHQPGAHRLTTGARLFDAASAAGVRPNAYLAGAAWLHQPAKEEQQGLKIGILHDLTVLIRHARLEALPARVALGQRLRQQIETLPVTGRLVTALDPVRLELERRHNRPVHDGDRLTYPARPDTITVRGAVEQDCTLPFTALKPAADYIRDCTAHAEADPDWIYIIQPDGYTTRHGIGPWNREAAQALAPGAQVLVTLRNVAGNSTDELNAELARFLATQGLPVQGAQP